MTQKKQQLTLIRSVFLPPGLQSRNMIFFLFPVMTPCSSKSRAMLWTSLSFSVTPLPSSHHGSKGVFHPWRLGLCRRLLPVKHALCYLFACGHMLPNWGRKTQPRHWSNESSCLSSMVRAQQPQKSPWWSRSWGDSTSSHAHPSPGILLCAPGSPLLPLLA